MILKLNKPGTYFKSTGLFKLKKIENPKLWLLFLYLYFCIYKRFNLFFIYPKIIPQNSYFYVIKYLI